ncbi:phosphoribosylformylglycinamidine synthase subunit PurS [Acetobacter orleanensis]|uniref:Phosphoribosylformylglycinamidine synthase subunit PurS n=1 Tax=Acetobacter orleanensis TaxID=104099 RepID=A0A4Y3TH56_9PROT|nr:phosphoribosylformylglycinamidine synthase subunit PurS [Acetobacter orleanensis]KXV63102.1 phosphoribosylformylglycinamidine synthase [Acetobacter orleanensis]PCD80272.1 phosphoribosylformylglycinamidine synthase [Acetobacter orleanensis]GAN68986.1 phosphoribosyl formylglycinamidine synthase PurS [Acetobacter orleanensis JCM 7639]GBR30513.1 phosphoribosyl formylglycinamidine synthase [Acetobacter orleanensis NRIC 0473]GEB81606.1 phosphoribosylformylglycinamidine synthase subunit PurS [Acet
MKVRVTVMLKEGVLDPQGKAIGHALHTLGFPGVQDVRVGKIIDLDVEGTDRAAVQKQAEDMGRDLLANLVIEDFTVEVLG